MADLLLKNHAPDAQGLVHRVTPKSAGWGHVGFELHRLKAGQSLEASTGAREACLVLVGGKARVASAAATLARSAIAWARSRAISRSRCTVVAERLSGRGEHRARARRLLGAGRRRSRRPTIRADQVAYSVRGTGSNTRHVYDILPEAEPAHSLLVVEVITPAGGWSSYPSHKHDTEIGRRIRAAGDLLPPAEPAAGFRAAARLYRRSLAGPDHGRGGRRRRARAPRLSPVRHRAWLRPLLPANATAGPKRICVDTKRATAGCSLARQPRAWLSSSRACGNDLSDRRDVIDLAAC